MFKGSLDGWVVIPFDAFGDFDGNKSTTNLQWLKNNFTSFSIWQHYSKCGHGVYESSWKDKIWYLGDVSVIENFDKYAKICTTCGVSGCRERVGKSVEMTCTSDGYTPYTCEVCKKVTKKMIIPAIGHSVYLKNAKEATCKSAGYSGDKYCTQCRRVFEKGETVAKLEHRFGGWKQIQAATKNKNGTEQHTCKDCGYNETRKILFMGEIIGSSGNLQQNTASGTQSDSKISSQTESDVTLSATAKAAFRVK